jgi:ubiquinone/menaquinone biosynthesis C-methylase UbiE
MSLSVLKNLIKETRFRLNFSVSESVVNRIAYNKSFNSLDSIKHAAEWLLIAHERSNDGGYSRAYNALSNAWDPGYIETTGYIIPTLYSIEDLLSDRRYGVSALRASEWLLTIQNADGSFSDIDKKTPHVFDTGQCILGLIATYKRTGDARYLDAAVNAAYWLVSVQELNGSWVRCSYNEVAHSYYSRVSAALYSVGSASGIAEFELSAKKNIYWVLKNQLPNGLYSHTSFRKDGPLLLHTIVYVLEGLLDYFCQTNDHLVLESLIKSADFLLNACLDEYVILPGSFSEDGCPLELSKCITGLAQWAGLCLRLHEITNNDDYRDVAIATLYYLKSKQLQGNLEINGGFFGSEPRWGAYAPYMIVNWGVKFFLDSMLLYGKMDVPNHREAEIYTKLTFRSSPNITTELLSASDEFYYLILRDVINNNLHARADILDLGCGRGKFIKQIKKDFCKAKIIGIDPCVFNDSSQSIVQGGIYELPWSDNSFDLVFTIEVLQHVIDLDRAFNEINRVLKSGGILIIGDRDRWSLLGLFKPILERIGKWMYPFDSPVREVWRTKREWILMLESYGFNVVQITPHHTSFSGIPYVNRYLTIYAEKRK